MRSISKNKKPKLSYQHFPSADFISPKEIDLTDDGTVNTQKFLRAILKQHQNAEQQKSEAISW